MSDPALKALIDCLREQHASIKTLEEKAGKAIYEEKDEAAYRALMQERAERVAGLHAACEPLLAALPDNEMRDGVEDDLQRFAAGGKNALRIGSVFYMSALLYPDDHTDGQPDNLERLINSLAGN